MELIQLEALAAVAECGSFHLASTRCGVSRSTLRSRVDALEAALGRPLLVRTQRGASITEFGTRYLKQARRVLTEMASLESLCADPDEDLRGTIRVKAQIGILLDPLNRFMEVARERYPELAVQVLLQEDPTLDLKQEVDLILHFGRKVHAGPYSTLSLGEIPVQALASRDYLDRAGRPACVGDLAQHRLLTWIQPGEDGACWPLLSGGDVRVRSALCTNSHVQLRSMALKGAGIAFVPNPDIALLDPAWDSLERVLPDDIGGAVHLTAVIPEARRHSPKKLAWLSLLRELQGAARGAADDSAPPRAGAR